MGLTDFFQGYNLVLFGVEAHPTNGSDEQSSYSTERGKRFSQRGINILVNKLENDGFSVPGLRHDDGRTTYVVKLPPKTNGEVKLTYPTEAIKIFPQLENEQ
ncbi:hypothetical protein HOI26_02475 [Candidatus Woesearchaeota archaeon]|mgnify:FL=1|jgi:hypothetical protein|nr:hypothetical protein [Candidatus Woesearchaeota archaeon]MBT5739944.1 hypothetical protein [Candidatus Woesearchaeota archaeon]